MLNYQRVTTITGPAQFWQPACIRFSVAEGIDRKRDTAPATSPEGIPRVCSPKWEKTCRVPRCSKQHVATQTKLRVLTPVSHLLCFPHSVSTFIGQNSLCRSMERGWVRNCVKSSKKSRAGAWYLRCQPIGTFKLNSGHGTNLSSTRNSTLPT